MNWFAPYKPGIVVDEDTGETTQHVHDVDVGTYSGGYTPLKFLGLHWLISTHRDPTALEETSMRAAGGKPEAEGRPAEPTVLKFRKEEVKRADIERDDGGGRA